MRLFILSILFLGVVHCTCGQSVTVSKEISIKNDKAYDLIGDIDDRLILFRDEGNKYEFSVFDQDLSHIMDRELTFEKKTVDINGIVSQDTCFHIIYSYKDRREIVHRIRSYDNKMILQDSSELFREPKTYGNDYYLFKTSENKEFSVLFNFIEKDEVEMFVIKHDSLYVDFKKILKVEDIDLRENFKKIAISNRGEMFLLLEQKNSRYSKDENHFGLFVLDHNPNYFYSKINLYDRVSSGVDLEFDNINRRICIGGLWHEKNKDQAEGYFYFNKPLITLKDLDDAMAQRFTPDFIAEVTGKEIGKIDALRDLEVNDIVIRQDGGFIMMAETKREYIRQSSYGAPGSIGRRPGGWVDHFYEDVIIIALHPDGEEHWAKVLFKKQFSQDDSAVFSSYFLMKTPSRLRLIYNDEIKNNNTVSEYIIDPVGKYNRNSLLSTDYQNLKLRFADAVQVSGSEIVIPSEKSRKLSLVKIEY